MVAADTPINRRVIKEVAVPLLKEAGVNAEVAWVDTTDQGTIFQGNDQAAVTFRSKEIDRVMFLGGARLASIFTTVAAAQSFTATYAVSSFDNPQFFVNNPDTIPPETMEGMVGIGFNPSQDVPDSQYAVPHRHGRDGVRRTSTRPRASPSTSREAARVALPYCDAARLLKAAGDEVTGDLNAGAWAEAARRSGPGSAPRPGSAARSGRVGTRRPAPTG